MDRGKSNDHSGNQDRQQPVLLSHCQPPDADPEVVRELLRPFDAALEQNDAFPLLPIAWTTPWSATPAAMITAVLLEDARFREANGDISGAIRQMVRAIHLCRSLSLQTAAWNDWLRCLDAERVALGRLRLILGTAELSAVDLQTLFETLKSELFSKQTDGRIVLQWHDPWPMLRRRTVFWTDAAADPQGYFEVLWELPVAARGFDAEYRLQQAVVDFEFRLGRIHAARAVHAMAFSEALLWERYRQFGSSGRVQFYGTSQTESINQLRRFLATSTVGDLEKDLVVLDANDRTSGILAPHIDTIASERATLLTIKLQQFRLAHKTLPASLLELKDDDPSNTLIYQDPWSGAPFFYTNQTAGHAVRLWGGFKSPDAARGSALLASTGWWALNFHSMFGQIAHTEPIEVYELPPAVVLFVGPNDPVDWRLKQIATSVKTIP